MKQLPCFFVLVSVIFAQEPVQLPVPVPINTEEIAAASILKKKPDSETKDGYTINYNTISIIEYIRFASKICNTNFLFNEEDLNFTVTVLSEGPITPENVMSTLVQILRIHGLQLLEQDNNLVIHKSDDVKQLAKLVTGSGQGGKSPIVTRIFRIKNAKADSIAAIIRPMISQAALLEVSAETRQLILTDVTANVDKVANLIENLDSPHTQLQIRSYEIQNNRASYLTDVVAQIMAPIAQGNPFIMVPAVLSNAIYIVSTPELSDKAIDILKGLDVPPNSAALALRSENILVYKPDQSNGEEILKGLEQITVTLKKSGVPDRELLQSLQSAKWSAETNSIMVVGSKESLDKIKEFLTSLDHGKGLKFDGDRVPISTQFLIYKPKYQKGDQLVGSVKEVVENLKSNQLSDPGLLRALQTMKWVKTTNSVLFTGDPTSLKKVDDLMGTLDTPTGMKPGSEKNFFIYQLQYVSKDRTESYVKQVTDNLHKRGDEDLIYALKSMTWLEPSQSFMFSGTNDSLERIKEMMTNFDKPATAKSGKGYFIYKLQTMSGEAIEDDLDTLAKNFKTSGVKDTKVLEVIDNIRYVKETNSLLLTGDPQAIDEVKDLIAKYDYPREASAKSSFFMYKPVHLTASNIQQSLKDISANLRQEGLVDQAFLTTIDSVKYVSTTNSLIFTGSTDSLNKVQALLKDVDVPLSKMSPIQQIGKTTFLLYKLKNAGGPQIISSVKAMAADLKKSGTSDKDFLAALNSMKYVKETNSLMFTGTEDALKKVEGFVEKFDVTALSGPALKPDGFGGSTNFFVYNPKSLPGPELEKLLQDFAENLKLSGLSDPDLFNSVSSMRWVEKTQSLIFTGTPKALDKIKELLQNFDNPSNLAGGPAAGGAVDSIQAIDNTSFLVYKLQFHKGDEIQGALRQIAKDLILSNAQVNQNLLNSINSIQWLEVTNSLLCSGDQETLTRLRELIKNLDIPLKQVFIEMLVVQTNLTNALTFGLEWAGKYKYRDKFSAAMNNEIPFTGTGTASPSQFTQNVATVTPTTTPNPSMIPFSSSGFELGVIGEVIRHGGNTFLSLGSLLSALQTDDETTIVMTPKLITQDGRTSTIFSGQNIPFAGSFVSNTGSNTTVSTSNIEYRDIGLNLTITPVLGNSDIVTLDISLDQSTAPTDAANQQLTFNGSNTAVVNGITTSKTTMQTTVHVPDDHFLILSGMVNNTSVKSKAGIPCLGGLPLIGAAFSKDNNTVTNNNIVIFLRPHILSSMDDLKAITHAQEEFFRDQAGTPNIQRNYDEAMELIKSVDDE